MATNTLSSDVRPFPEINWIKKEYFPKTGDIKHCLFDVGKGVGYTGEMVAGRFYLFGHCYYCHEDIEAFVVIEP